MKIIKSCLFIFAIGISSILMWSCNKASKAKPIIEKVIEREGAQVEKSAIKEAEEFSARRKRVSRPRHHSLGDDSYSQPSSTYIQCSQCNGAGAVYIIDYYGNIQYDYYGNPMITQCTNCGGAGSILVSH